MTSVCPDDLVRLKDNDCVISLRKSTMASPNGYRISNKDVLVVICNVPVDHYDNGKFKWDDVCVLTPAGGTGWIVPDLVELFL